MHIPTPNQNLLSTLALLGLPPSRTPHYGNMQGYNPEKDQKSNLARWHSGVPALSILIKLLAKSYRPWQRRFRSFIAYIQ